LILFTESFYLYFDSLMKKASILLQDKTLCIYLYFFEDVSLENTL